MQYRTLNLTQCPASLPIVQALLLVPEPEYEWLSLRSWSKDRGREARQLPSGITYLQPESAGTLVGSIAARNGEDLCVIQNASAEGAVPATTKALSKELIALGIGVTAVNQGGSGGGLWMN